MSQKISIPNYHLWHPGLTTQSLNQMADVYPKFAVLANMGWQQDGIGYLVQEYKGGETCAVCVDGSKRVMPRDLEFYVKYGHGVRRCVPGYAAAMLAALVDNKG